MNVSAQTNVSESSRPRAAYLVQRDNRKRFTFGNVWTEAVKTGEVTDKEKLVAHAVKLKVGTKSSVAKLRFETLLAKVQKALTSASSTTAH